jgi:membrane protein DedA with SNARE-associated domain
MKAAAVGVGGWLTLALLLPMEAGVPIPIPADLVMFTVGERVAAGAFPLWLAVAGFEVISVAGTTVLFLACRGPLHQLIRRFGPRIGLTAARVSAAARLVETRGRTALAVGRGTPGLRTLTVVAAAASGLGWRRALPALILGSSVFLQLHLILGLLLGPLADKAFNEAKGPALAAAAVLVASAFVFWRVRRGRRGGPEAWAEAACPACIGLGVIAGRVPALTGLAGQQRAGRCLSIGACGSRRGTAPRTTS